MDSSKIYGQLLCYLLLVLLGFLLVFLARDVVSKEAESCYADNSNPYIYTGTTTAYQLVNNNITERITLSNCKPVYIWMYCRHGTRYPSRSKMSAMLNLTHVRNLIVDNHKIHKRGQLCDQDIQNLKNWSPYQGLIAQNHKHLTSQGEKDLSTLGERFRTRYPELFDANKPENYKFESTKTQRTIASMASFISGAFGDDFVADMRTDSLVNDSVIIKMINKCQPWLEEMNSTRANEQFQEFANGPEMTEVVANVNRRLGFAGSNNKDDVFLMYDMCRFEKAWYPDRLSPWCAAFTDDEMRVLEYKEDLTHYYYSGYGLKINRKFGCAIVQDMFYHFVKLEHDEGTDGLKGSFFFAHSVGATQLFTSMGIAKDTEHLTAWNYKDMAHRNWRTSLLVPFATNFAAVFHRCDSEDSPFKVAFYLAEKPMTLEGCENGVCDWAKLKETLGLVANNCNQQVCRKP